MTAEQLEELLGKVTPEDADGDWVPDSYCDGRHSPSDRELIFIAPSLARRVLCAEKLVEALEKIRHHSAISGNSSVRGHIDAALTAYREASK